jgi:hypothetical protein
MHVEDGVELRINREVGQGSHSHVKAGGHCALRRLRVRLDAANLPGSQGANLRSDPSRATPDLEHASTGGKISREDG